MRARGNCRAAGLRTALVASVVVLTVFGAGSLVIYGQVAERKSTGEYEREELYFRTIVAFASANYSLARENAKKILSGLPEGQTDYRQCRAILEDQGPVGKRIGHSDEDQPPKDIDYWRFHQLVERHVQAQRHRLPDEFEDWDKKQKLDFLIEALDTVSLHPVYSSNHDDYASRSWLNTDVIVWNLIQLGDAAVPRLLDVVESDERLTRAVRQGTIVTTKWAAAVVLDELLGFDAVTCR